MLESGGDGEDVGGSEGLLLCDITIVCRLDFSYVDTNTSIHTHTQTHSTQGRVENRLGHVLACVSDMLPVSRHYAVDVIL